MLSHRLCLSETPHLTATPKTNFSGAPWSTAESNCLAAGYDGLTSILNGVENNFVHGMVVPSTTNLQRYWMGFNDIASEGSWVWASGEAVTYTSWAPGEPNNGGGNEDCGHLYNPQNSFGFLNWNDHVCSTPQSFICESR
jgi:hypothetical protein